MTVKHDASPAFRGIKKERGRGGGEGERGEEKLGVIRRKRQTVEPYEEMKRSQKRAWRVLKM